MTCGDYQIFIRENATFKRVAQVSLFNRLELTRRLNDVGAWSLEFDRVCQEIPHYALNGKYGIEVWRNGSRIFTGPITKVNWNKSGDERVIRIGGTDEIGYLSRRVIMPDPFHAVSPRFNAAYVTYTPDWGWVEDVMKDLVRTQIGPEADPARKIPFIDVEESYLGGLGINKQFRFDNLLTSLQDLILYVDGYRFDMEQTTVNEAEKIQFKMKPVKTTWKTGENGNEFSERLRNLGDYDYTFEAPEFNFVLVGGQRDAGQPGGDDPKNRVFAFSGNEYSRAHWGTIETFIDRRDLSDVNQLAQVCWEELGLPYYGKEDPEKNMLAKVNVTAELLEVEGGPQLFTDFDLGDYVRVVIHEEPDENEDIEVLDYIKEWNIVLDENGETVKAYIGGEDKISTNNGIVPFIKDSIQHLKERIQNLEGAY